MCPSVVTNIELFTDKVTKGNSTYFFDVKRSENGSIYHSLDIVISQQLMQVPKIFLSANTLNNIDLHGNNLLYGG